MVSLETRRPYTVVIFDLVHFGYTFFGYLMAFLILWPPS